jgi:hypothetical protein
VIPIVTTKISVMRPATNRVPYGPPPAMVAVATGVNAHITTSTGVEDSTGAREIVWFRLACDPVDLRHGDVVIDERTGAEYDVQWARVRTGAGVLSTLDHVQAGLIQRSGVRSAPHRG